MDKTKRKRTIAVMVVLCVIFLVLAFVVGPHPKAEGISEAMRDAVLHEEGRIDLFGLMAVNPSLISGFIVTGIILLLALLIRIFAIPKFSRVPGKLQAVLEALVGYFSDLAKEHSEHRNGFLGVYLFGAGVYVCVGTLFELFGVQALTVANNPIALPAPIADINGAIAIGCCSYLVILSGGIAGNGIKGVGLTLKEFSLPISMSFRLFGALLSGLLVTELVYYYVQLSIVLPVIIGVLFTLLHAVIQAYVLTMLTAMFYGEVSEPAGHKAH